MNSLIIDCSAGMSLILLKDKKEFSFIDNDAKRHSDELLLKLDELFCDSKLTINDINNICVCTGPGSFTGVRVAISICKGLAIGSNAKVFALSNLDVYKIENVKNSVLVLDGFSQFVYVRIFKNGIFEDKCLSFEDLKDLYSRDKFSIYVENEKVQNKLNNIELTCIIAEKDMKNAFLNKIKNQEMIELNQIEPLYLRASQAEIERSKKLAGAK